MCCFWLEDNEKRVHAVREKKAGCQADFLTVNHKWGFELKELFYQEALYLEAQQEAGVTHSLVSPVPQLFLYDLAFFYGSIATFSRDSAPFRPGSRGGH